MRTKFRKEPEKTSHRTKFAAKKIYISPDVELPLYRVGDILEKRGCQHRGIIISDRVTGSTLQSFGIVDKKTKEPIKQRYEAKQLWVLGYLPSGRIKQEVMDRLTAVRTRYTKKQFAADERERLLKQELNKKLGRRRNKGTEPTCRTKRSHRTKRRQRK